MTEVDYKKMSLKIPCDQHTWLTERAQQVRNNNDAPVPAGERVYPNQLIEVAISYLMATDVDWNMIQSQDDLMGELGLEGL
ncbi:MAG: hypothetical protein AAGF01_04975 [Cyanobacteria bacterium P01_G01_bin.38]